MKWSVPALILLLPSAAFALDCPGSTTYEILRQTHRRVYVEYTLHDGSQARPTYHLSGNQAQLDLALAQCSAIEAQAEIRDERLSCDPSFVSMYPEDVTTDANAPTTALARRRAQDRAVMRDVWPESTERVRECLVPIVERLRTQGNASFQRQWIANGNSERFNKINARVDRILSSQAMFDEEEAHQGSDL